MNNLKNLTIRTKKSLSGLLSGHGDEGPGSIKAAENTTPTSPVTPLENDSTGLEEFGAIGRDSFSSSKDSPSKRHRLLGSLRTIGSMRSLRSCNVKSDDDMPPLSPARVHPEITPIKRERPSLALAFEEAPFHCFSGTEIEDIRHRAAALPIAEPVKDSVINPPGLSVFTVGSVMDSPAPIQKMLDRENRINAIPKPSVPTLHMYDGVVPTPPVFSPMAECPLPTPMPGTNLPMDGDAGVLAPEIYVSSPAKSVKEQDELPGYFDFMPMVIDQPHTDQEHANYTNNHIITKEFTAPNHENVCMLAPIENDILQPHTSRVDVLPRPFTESTENDIPQSHSSYVTVAKKSNSCDPQETMIPSTDSDLFALDESRNSLDAKKDMVRAFLAHEKQPSLSDEDTCSLERRLSAWGRHNGLYDGTGYGDDEAALRESILHESAISRTTRDGAAIKGTPISTPLPESIISEEDTIDLAQHIIFEDSAEGKCKAKVEDPLLLGPDKKWSNYTADERKEMSVVPQRKNNDDDFKETIARGETEPLRPNPELPNSPIDEAAALDELIRTYGDHWYKKDALGAQDIRFMGLLPEEEVMARREMTEDERKAEEAAVAQRIWSTNKNKAMKNKALRNTREPKTKRLVGHLSEQDIEDYGEPTDEMKSEVVESFKQMNESLGG